MKLTYLSLMLLFSLNSFGGFVSINKINECDRNYYSEKIPCEQIELTECAIIDFDDNGMCGVYDIEETSTGKKVVINEDKLTLEVQRLQNLNAIKLLREKGRKARQACDDVLDLIGGFNLQRSSEETDVLSTNFAAAKTFLMEGRPGKAKYQIQQIPVDGVIVTNEMKTLVLSILNDYEAVP